MTTRGSLFAGAAAIALGLAAAGCSGARSHVVAPTTEYPISMSDGIRDENGNAVADQDKEVVGYFMYDYKAWGMWWRIFSFTGDKDISDEMNRQVKAANGEGVINLSVKAENCTWNVFTFIGLFPDCSTVRVRGNIVRRRHHEVAVAPAASPVAPPVAPTAPTPVAPPATSAIAPPVTSTTAPTAAAAATASPGDAPLR